MSEQHEDDFGAPHGKRLVVQGQTGTLYAAYYADGTWWEGSPGTTRIQLDEAPARLYDPQVSA